MTLSVVPDTFFPWTGHVPPFLWSLKVCWNIYLRLPPKNNIYLHSHYLYLTFLSQPPLWNWQGSCLKDFESLSKTLFSFQEAFWHTHCIIQYSLPHSTPLQVRPGHWGLSNWGLSLLASGANLSHGAGGQWEVTVSLRPIHSACFGSPWEKLLTGKHPVCQAHLSCSRWDATRLSPKATR